jgi:hypothetical protein
MEMPEVRIPYTMPALSVPHNYHVDEVPSHLAEEPGFGQAYNMDDANRLWADPSEEVSKNAYLKKYTLPAQQAEISRAVSLAQNLAPAQPEAIPSATEALAAVEKFQNAGIFSGNEYDKAGEILAAHNRAKFDNIPVEEPAADEPAEPAAAASAEPPLGAPGTAPDIVRVFNESVAAASASSASAASAEAGSEARIAAIIDGARARRENAEAAAASAVSIPVVRELPPGSREDFPGGLDWPLRPPSPLEEPKQHRYVPMTVSGLPRSSREPEDDVRDRMHNLFEAGVV